MIEGPEHVSTIVERVMKSITTLDPARDEVAGNSTQDTLPMNVAIAYRTDQIKERSAGANARSVNGVQKKYCRIHRVSQSTGSRHFAGENAPSTQFLAYAAAASKATAFPYIAEAWAVINQVQIEDASISDLLARLAEIDELEHDADADEDRQRLRAAENPTPEQRKAAAAADMRAAELLLERNAIQSELALRGA